MHVLTHNHIGLPVHAQICTHRGTSVQRTPSILKPDPGLHSVFTCKWSTTICGPSRRLCPSSRLGLGKSCSSDGGTTSDGLQWRRSQTLRREEMEGGKRLPAWQPRKQQGLPHMMEALHALGSISDWRAEGERLRTQPKAFLSGSGSYRRAPGWGPSGVPGDGWEPGVLLVGRGVIFDKCICGCGGVGVNDKKAGTAVSMHIQVTWCRDGACLYLFLVIVCRVFACPSVLAGQTRWRSRHMDQAFCPSAPLKVHLMVVDLDRTHQLRWAGSVPRVNGPDFQSWHIRSHPGHAQIGTFPSFRRGAPRSPSSKWGKDPARSSWPNRTGSAPDPSERGATSGAAGGPEQLLWLVASR